MHTAQARGGATGNLAHAVADRYRYGKQVYECDGFAPAPDA